MPGNHTPVPDIFSKLSRDSIICLAYFMKQKISGEDRILGHELVRKISPVESHAPRYLQVIDELGTQGWLELVPDSDSLLQIRPYCWLQARLEMGNRFAVNQGNPNKASGGFSSNEEYLDEVIGYLNQLAKRLRNSNQSICSDDVHHLPEWEADCQYQEIEQKLANTSIPIPAAAIKKDLNLSGWQYLFLMGMLGRSERAIGYDFADINDVVVLFASGYNVRRVMREHLAGKESPLVKHKLFESSEDCFFTSSKLSPKAMRLITGKQAARQSAADTMAYAAKDTIFDMERPKVKENALMLPQQIMETIETILHNEKKSGKKIRAELRKSLPTTFGTPLGTTILLYGPSGTGKTLTATYLAGKLNVPVLKVDCSKILGKYIGESEKQVRKIFDDYTTVAGLLHAKPVLLLNEADQLLGERGTANSFAEQMNNNIQNLFLEGLERFDGILVATTNRKDLLDSAYSRRFTYKLELPAPDAALRKKLWQCHLPEKLSDTSINLDQLAELDLTGGEIRLVLEQAVRTMAFRGEKKLNGSMLYECAHKELIASGRPIARQRIGFDGGLKI